MLLPVRLAFWEIQCCTKLTVGDDWEGVLTLEGAATPWQREIGLFSTDDEKIFVESDDTVTLVGNVDRKLGKTKRGRIALIRAKGLGVVAFGAPKTGGIIRTGRIWQDGHASYIESSKDAKACRTRGVIRTLEQVEQIYRNVIDMSWVPVREGARIERSSTDEFPEERDDPSVGWIARFEVELIET